MIKVLLISLLAVPSLGFAQGEKVDQEKGYLRFLFLGTPAPSITKKIGNRMVELDVPPGEEPPQQLFVRNANPAPLTFKPRIKRISQYFEITDRTQPVDLFEGNEAKGQPWLKCKAGAVPATVVVLKKPGAADNGWKDAPRSLTFRDDIAAFPLHSVRVINLSSREIAFRIGPDKSVPAKAIGPNNLKIFGADAGVKQGQQAVSIGYKGRDGRWRKLFQNAIVILKNQRFEIYVYDPDREHDRKNGGKPKFHMLPLNFRDPAVRTR